MEQTQQPKRILQVIGIMNRGGAEAMIMNLYRNVDRKRVQFDFVENSSERADYDDEIETMGGRIYRCPHFNGINIFSYRKWWENFFREHKGDYSVVHGHIGSTASIYLDVAHKNGIYTLAHSHNSYVTISGRQIMYNLLAYRTRYIADHFFACSVPAATTRYGRKVAEDPKRCDILPNAIDTELYRYNEIIRGEVREELHIPKGTIVLGHVGRFAEQKNHQFLLTIFSEYLRNYPNSMLLLVGDGGLRSAIIEQMKQLGITDQVRMLGVRKDVNRILQAMDVLVFPSLYEGLPVTLVEAQAAGLPCHISDAVPADSILIESLVTTESLSDSSADWAANIHRRISDSRQDTSEQIVRAGFDIKTSARWLEEFYCER